MTLRFYVCNKERRAKRDGRSASEFAFIHLHRSPAIPPFTTSLQMQTVRKVTKEMGMLHSEGGWPKEINVKDEEAVQRFRRRVEKDENWVPRMKKLTDVSRFEISIIKYVLALYHPFLSLFLLLLFLFFSVV